MSLRSFPVLDRLRVGSSSGPNRSYLDGIRGVAVILILLRHSWGLSGQPLYSFTAAGHTFRPGALIVMMYIGVNLFFVLSGYLLAQPYLRASMGGSEPPGYRSYARKRFLRIAPPYYAAIFIVLLFGVPFLIDASQVYSLRGLASLGFHAVFLQTSAPVSFGSFTVLSPLWTISIEMIFYLVLPFMVRGFLRRRWMLGLPVCLAIALLWLWMSRHSMGRVVNFLVDHGGRSDFSVPAARFMLSHQFPAHLTDFAVGITVANIVVRREQGWNLTKRFRAMTSPKAGLVYVALGLALVVGFMAWNGGPSLDRTLYDGAKLLTLNDGEALRYYYLEGIPFGVGFGLVILGVSIGPAWQARLAGLWPLSLIGVLGYSLYMFHMPLFHMFGHLPFIQRLDPPQHWPALFAMSGLIVVFCLGFYLAVERPMMVLARRPRPSRAPEAAAGHPGRPDPPGGEDTQVVEIRERSMPDPASPRPPLTTTTHRG